jgi:hypothetical protein
VQETGILNARPVHGLSNRQNSVSRHATKIVWLATAMIH